jgi:ABC-type iron transport system FetAB ATPase subunit
MSRLKTEGLRTKSGGPYSFAVERGECVAISGPSGCGKTLLLRALADLDPAEGTVLLDGENRNEMIAPQWRRKVGWLPAEAAWWADTVGEHFSNGWKNESGSGILPLARGWKPLPHFQTLEKLGFSEDVLEWRIERLSTGEKQRLALFRLLLNEPQVLLLDEPTAALDHMNVGLVENLVTAYRRDTGAAVVWISHSPEQIARVADCHLQFRNGGLETAE